MKRIIIILVALGLIAGGGYLGVQYMAGTSAAQSTATPTPLPAVLAGNQVVSEGKVVPVNSAQLRFESAGTISEVLVREGDKVKQGQPLARLDPRDLALKVAEAKTDLAKAQAAYDKMAADATPEEIAAAEAVVAARQGQLAEVQGKVTDSDIAAARANLAKTQEELKKLLAGPEETDVREAQARLDQANTLYNQRQVALQQTRDDASKAKTDAERKLQETTLDLQKAQSEYSQAYWNYHGVKQDGRQPETEKGRSNGELSDYGNLEQAEAFKQAEIKLQTAQLALEQAKKDQEQAQKDEVTKIADAEQEVANAKAQVDEAQAKLDDVLKGADTNEIARARADVADAQARLDELLGQGRQGSLSAAQADVAEAQAKLDELKAPKRTVDLGESKVAIQQAEVNLQKAQLALDKATLVAPIDGTVASVGIEIGELADPQATVITVGDLSRLEIETKDLTELQVVDVNEGDAVTLTFDALPGVAIKGKVTRIKALGENKQGDIVYTVTVTPDQQDARLRWNMTSQVAITK